MKTDISVIVPVYKIDEQLLRNCLDSLISQTLQTAQFLVIDDGSPDNCGKICDEYQEKDSRITVIHTENKGVSNARNVGLDKAEGRYILFVDGDDFVEPDVCEKCITAMDRADVDILFFMHVTTKNPMLTPPKTDEIENLNEKQIEKIRLSIIAQADPFDGFWVGPPWGKVFRKSIIQDNKLNFVLGLRKSQDRVFVLDYMLNVQKAALYKYCGYHYVLNETSICRRYNKNIVSILEMAQEEFEKRVQENRYGNIEYEQAINTMNLIFITEYFTLNFFNTDNELSVSNRVSELRKLLQMPAYQKALKYGKMDNIGRKKRAILILLKMKMYRFAAFCAPKLL